MKLWLSSGTIKLVAAHQNTQSRFMHLLLVQHTIKSRFTYWWVVRWEMMCRLTHIGRSPKIHGRGLHTSQLFSMNYSFVITTTWKFLNAFPFFILKQGPFNICMAACFCLIAASGVVAYLHYWFMLLMFSDTLKSRYYFSLVFPLSI